MAPETKPTSRFRAQQAAVVHRARRNATDLLRRFEQDVSVGNVNLGEHLLEEKARAEGRLMDFVRLFWHEVEPGKPFVDGWVVGVIAEHLEAVTRGEIKNLLINVPPGCMKSLLVNVFWPAWEWGPKNLPYLRILSASYVEKLAVRDNITMRALVRSDRYRRFWGDRVQIARDQDNTKKFGTTLRGFKEATYVGGSTGSRGDRAVLDDPHNVEEAESEAMREQALRWYSNTWTTRVNDIYSANVVIMQRVHTDDVSSLILKSGIPFEHLVLPMRFEADKPRKTTVLGFTDPRKTEGELLWPERFPETYLATEVEPKLRLVGGEYAIAGQLQQRPIPRGGGMFQKDRFHFADAAPAGGLPVRAWDLASSKDSHAARSAGVRMKRVEGRLYIEDAVVGQWKPEELYAVMRSTAERDGYDVEVNGPQDPGQAGVAQVQSLAALLRGFVFLFTPETGSKEDRAKPFAAEVNGGNVTIIRGEWNKDFIEELAAFPMATRKDQVDACSRGYARIILLERMSTNLAGPILVTGD